MPGALRTVKNLAEYFKLAKGFDQCLNKVILFRCRLFLHNIILFIYCHLE